MLYLVPLCAFSGALIGAYLLVRSHHAEILAGAAAGIAVLAGFALLSEGAATGLDVFVYTALIWGALIPAGLAMGLGALIGGWERS